MELIASRQNALVKRLRTLSRDGSRSDDVLLVGTHLIEEACASGVDIEVAAFAADTSNALPPLARRAADAGARIIAMPADVIASASPTRTPADAIGIARVGATAVADVLARAPQLVLLLDGVQDPGNVGAIVRAAEAFGATGVVAGPGTADPRGWKALRGSMGSTFRVPVGLTTDVAGTLRAARAAGVRILATVPRDGHPPRLAALRDPCLVLIGGEGAGLSAELAARADDRITIEMRPPVESLNVAVAAALIAYEASRQRADDTFR